MSNSINWISEDPFSIDILKPCSQEVRRSLLDKLNAGSHRRRMPTKEQTATRIRELEEIEDGHGFVYFGEKQWLLAVLEGHKVCYGEWAKSQLTASVYSSFDYRRSFGDVWQLIAGGCGSDLVPNFVLTQKPYTIDPSSRFLYFPENVEHPDGTLFGLAFDVLSQLPYLLDECEESMSPKYKKLFEEEGPSLQEIFILDEDTFGLDVDGEHDSICDYVFVNWELSTKWGQPIQ